MSDAADFGRGGWTDARLAGLSGKTYFITGGNSGIGYEAARMLGAKGAEVVIFCRNKDKAMAAVDGLTRVAPAGKFSFISMDLADLSWVRLAAKQARELHERIDGLICNAGIMMTPKRVLTADGFETQFGVNHLGHFAFAGLLSDLVEKASGRFVTVSSIAHKYGAIAFDNLTLERSYSPVRAYCQSKLANLVHALELDRRLRAQGCSAISVACHPGYSDTNLQTTGPSAILAAVMRPLTAMLSQPAEKGALPTVLGAAGGEASAGGYYGPKGFREFTGPVGAATPIARASDQKSAARLWLESEKLTGVEWPIFEKGISG